MSTEQNKNVIRRFYEEVFNRGKYEVLDEICLPNYANHFSNNPPGLPNNREGVRQIVMIYRNAIPNLHFTIDDILAEEDLVVCRWTSTGTQTGELLGIPPTGKSATVTGTDIERLENGIMAEGWGVIDQLGLLQQLGVIPPMDQVQAAQMKNQGTSTRRSGQQPTSPRM